MIRPLDVVTEGYLNSPLSVATSGYLYIAIVSDSGGHKRNVYAPSEELLKRRIRDDEEVIQIIVMAVQSGII